MARKTETRTISGYDVKLVRSDRRSMSLIIRQDNTLEMHVPYSTSIHEIDQAIYSKSTWIKQKLTLNKQLTEIQPLPPEQCRRADQLILARIEHLQAAHHLTSPRKIIIRDLVSRWGSCSSCGTISINRRCSLLPQDLMDLVIVHEHCHLTELNHSNRFYGQLIQKIPDARLRQTKLKMFHLSKKRI
jgi:predicted metal-dependent hydrolase